MKLESRTPTEALRALVDKLEQIKAHPSYQAVWSIADVHGFKYVGPDWEEELKQAKILLSEWEDTKP